MKNFKDYVEFFIKDQVDEQGAPLKIFFEKCGPRWEVAVTTSDKGYQHMSFVNSIATTKGGRHMDYVTNMLVSQLSTTLSKKNKTGIDIKPFQVGSHFKILTNLSNLS